MPLLLMLFTIKCLHQHQYIIIPHPPQVQQSQPNQRTAGPPYTYTSDHVLGRVKTAIANQMDGYESRTHSCCRSNNSTRISSHTSPKDSVAAVLGEVKTEFKREMQKVKEAKKEVKNEFKKMWTS
ncbi:hypothetical protein BDR26DRAFT_304629 [Obelidium mucronatum]|nr:hypothetical protein BDR26DRAFT_304629 [Obelidium mucronatum]